MQEQREQAVLQALRSIEWPTPSHRLVAAVVTRAILDLEAGGMRGEGASHYLFGSNSPFTAHCQALGLSPRYVRRIVRRTECQKTTART